MSIQRADGSFRAGSTAVFPNLNLADSQSLFVVNTVGWTPGNTQIDSLSLVPPYTQSWTLLNVSVEGLLQWEISPAMPFGKLGKIVAGLVLGGSPTSSPGTNANGSLLPIPQDQSTLATLWDPAVDPLPPLWPSGAFLPISGSVSLPSPIRIDQGVPLGIGIWIYPSLIGAAGSSGDWVAAICSARYMVTYDDGVTPPSYA